MTDKQRIKNLKVKVKKVEKQRNKAIGMLAEYKEWYEEHIRVIKEIRIGIAGIHVTTSELPKARMKWWVHELDMNIMQDEIDRDER